MVLAILEIISKGVLSRRDAFGMDNCQFSIISKGVLWTIPKKTIFASLLTYLSMWISVAEAMAIYLEIR